MKEPAAERLDSRRTIAKACAIVAALFVLATAGLLFWLHQDLSQHEPLFSARAERLNALAAQHLAQPKSVLIKQEILALDQLLRERTFDRLAQLRVGATLLVIGLAVMLLAAHLSRAPYHPTLAGAAAARSLEQRMLLALIFLIGCAAIAAARRHAPLTLPPPSSLTPVAFAPLPAVATPTTPTRLDPPPTPQGMPLAPPPSRAAWLAAWPAFRGPEQSGIFTGTLPRDWEIATGKGVRWSIKIPLPGLSSPIVWGDRVIVTGGTRTEHAVYAYAQKDGARLWTGRYKSDPDAPTEYPVWDELEPAIHAAPTPVTDGRIVAAAFANGEVACFDFATGTCRWARFLGSPAENMYGLASSLLLHENTLYVMHDSEINTLSAFDVASGELKWRSEREEQTWASPLLTLEKEEVSIVIAGNPFVSCWDALSGAKRWQTECLRSDPAPSPIRVGDRIIAAHSSAGIFALPLTGPAGTILWHCDRLEQGSFPESTSPVSDGERIYFAQDEMLVVLAVADGKVLAEIPLGGTVSYASPSIIRGTGDGGQGVLVLCNDAARLFSLGEQPEKLGEWPLPKPIETSPAFAEGALILREATRLIYIGEAGE